MIKMKINFPTLADIMRENDPDRHREVFIQTANDLIINSVPKINTQIKKNFNINMKKHSLYKYAVATKVDGKSSLGTGNVNIYQASQSKPVIAIEMDGEPINASRFDMSYDAEIAKYKGYKKQADLIRKAKKVTGSNRTRPRTQIKPRATPKTLGKAFYATMPKSGHSGIFRRKGDGIIELRTITLASMFFVTAATVLIQANPYQYLTKGKLAFGFRATIFGPPENRTLKVDRGLQEEVVGRLR